MQSEVYTLHQLTTVIKSEIENTFVQPVSFVAEINQLSVARNGHAYLDLIEKSENTESIIAQMRATCWASNFRIIKPYFESVTGEPLRPGIKIMARGQISFHQIYGLAINITSITPEYTVGELAIQRKQTIDRLTNDGVIDINKTLQLPLLIKNIAVISSLQAAGYGDFVNQLNNNQYGYKFNITLFEAMLQGDEAENTIINQLDKIVSTQDKFDCIVLIRGGGSKADLSCFDKYRLCYNLCQVPLPIITGIGHERDQSVADIVANTALKTPTAVAQFILDRAQQCNRMIENEIAKIKQSINNYVLRRSSKFDYIKHKLSGNIQLLLHQQETKLNNLVNTIIAKMQARQNNKLMSITNIETKIELSNPINVLRKGYSYTMHNSKIITDATKLTEGETISTILYNGKIDSKVTKISK